MCVVCSVWVECHCAHENFSLIGLCLDACRITNDSSINENETEHQFSNSGPTKYTRSATTRANKNKNRSKEKRETNLTEKQNWRKNKKEQHRKYFLFHLCTKGSIKWICESFFRCCFLSPFPLFSFILFLFIVHLDCSSRFEFFRLVTKFCLSSFVDQTFFFPRSVETFYFVCAPVVFCVLWGEKKERNKTKITRVYKFRCGRLSFSVHLGLEFLQLSLNVNENDVNENVFHICPHVKSDDEALNRSIQLHSFCPSFSMFSL